MSLLSQFFPSGGGVSAAQKIEVLLVGGGGGGGASGGTCINLSCCNAGTAGIVGGGGGGGQVVFSDGYEVIQDVSYPITVGAGGAGGGFYYDTTNVYYPRQSITPACPIGCYCPGIHDRNAGTLRGANGGNTIFGSVVSYGGGGGGGGMSNVGNYLSEICNGAAIAACSQWTAKGADGGTGGGSGSGYCGTGCLTIETTSPSPDVRPGRAIYNSSISFLKFGTDGTKFKVPSCFPNIDNSNPNFPKELAFSTLTYATGGGGNGNSAGPVAGSPICLVTPAVSLTCMTSAPPTNALTCFRDSDATSTCPGGQGFYSFCQAAPGPNGFGAALNAFMEGTIGEGSTNNQYTNCNDFLGSLRGGDGYEATVTPSPEYYGGGGGVVYAMSGTFACAVLAGAVISPGSPCYPSPSWVNASTRAWMTCPYGGKGGGGSVCTPLVTCAATPRCFSCVLNCAKACTFPNTFVVGVCTPVCVAGTPLPVPGTICPGAGISGCGGGGSSFHGGCMFTSTGDVFPNPTSDPGGADTCAFCGFAGGSGTVIIKYPTAFCAATVTGNTPIAPQSGYNVYKWTSPGSITFPSS